MDGITCPACRYSECGVIDSRPSDGFIRRRRKCDSCGCRFNTVEVIVADFDLRNPRDMYNLKASLNRISRRRNSREDVQRIMLKMDEIQRILRKM